MTSQDKDIETIRAMLNKCVVFAASDHCEEGALEEALREFGLVEASEAFESLERLIERTLPELPDGWFYLRVEQHPKYQWNAGSKAEPESYTVLITDNAIEWGRNGPTPRAAVLAALEKIGEK